MPVKDVYPKRQQPSKRILHPTDAHSSPRAHPNRPPVKFSTYSRNNENYAHYASFSFPTFLHSQKRNIKDKHLPNVPAFSPIHARESTKPLASPETRKLDSIFPQATAKVLELEKFRSSCCAHSRTQLTK